MKVTCNWLKEYVDLEGLSSEELAEGLTMAGLEVEAVQPLGLELAGLVVGKILAVEKHPEADKLTLCRVDAGQGPVDIVCGAPNVRPGLAVPVALPGTTTPGGQVIQAARIRKVTSYGMLCSERELGLSDDHSGIMVLPSDLLPGTPLNRALDLEDTLLEVNITPNRGDCLSHWGIARELAAIFDRALRIPPFPGDPEGREIREHSSVTILEPSFCPRYAARLLLGITVAPSPRWLRQRLEAVGVRSINNIVDVTNFVLLETGQPLHAFDFDLLAGRRIVVRLAAEGEPFTTLDGVERVLGSGMLVIADGEKAVALAGIMGGQESEIRPETRNVFLESALFNPVAIRRAAKKLGLSTEASIRFERGVDPEGVISAAARAVELMQELGGGRLIPGQIDEYPGPLKRDPIQIDVRKAGRFLGLPLTVEQALDIGRRLGLNMERREGERIEVRPPSFRPDLTRPVDLLEELARIIGYGQIPITFPQSTATGGREPESLLLRRRLEELLPGLGFDQVITYSFIADKWATFFSRRPEGSGEAEPCIRINNPISEDQSVMRPSLLPGLILTMKRNLSQRNQDLRLFEVGKVFSPALAAEALPRERDHLALLWTGRRYPGSFHRKEEAVDFFDLKGIVESIMEALQVGDFSLAPEKGPEYFKGDPYVRLLSGSSRIGEMGEISEAAQTLFDFKETAYLLELDLEQLRTHREETPTFKAWPRYPEATRDISLILDDAVTWQAIREEIQALQEPLIEKIDLFDLYRGKPIPPGKKNLGIRVHYRSSEQTLTEERIAALHQKVANRIIGKFKAALPGTG
ncbi:MAG: phenylalanine--tRNA ligase subunit beta [Deltaproteobacteria bacterium]|nr:phenylalanine--tRNA ligase subunit beta [Deltaproteobacteria bacterium]